MSRQDPVVMAISRAAAGRFHGRRPYVVISIRTPGESIAKLRSDPNRVARINAEFHDTTPEWERANPEPVEGMTERDASKIASFVLTHWRSADIVVHCHQGISRSAGLAAGILDAFSVDANAFEDGPTSRISTFVS